MFLGSVLVCLAKNFASWLVSASLRFNSWKKLPTCFRRFVLVIAPQHTQTDILVQWLSASEVRITLWPPLGWGCMASVFPPQPKIFLLAFSRSFRPNTSREHLVFAIPHANRWHTCRNQSSEFRVVSY